MDLIHKFGHEYCSILVFKMQVKLTPVHCETGLPGGNNRREGLLFHFNPRSPESAAGFCQPALTCVFLKIPLLILSQRRRFIALARDACVW